jgi:hypothetical protein
MQTAHCLSQQVTHYPIQDQILERLMVEGTFDCEDMLSADALAMQHSSAMCQCLLMHVERLENQVSTVVPPCGYHLADLLGSSSRLLVLRRRSCVVTRMTSGKYLWGWTSGPPSWLGVRRSWGIGWFGLSRGVGPPILGLCLRTSWWLVRRVRPR